MTEQRVSDEEVRRTAEAAEVMFSAGHYDPLVTRTKTVYDCSLMALDLLDARARVKVLEEIIRAEGFCPDGQILAEMCGCETCRALRGEEVGE